MKCFEMKFAVYVDSIESQLAKSRSSMNRRVLVMAILHTPDIGSLSFYEVVNAVWGSFELSNYLWINTLLGYECFIFVD